jgi:hypothetical protein
VVGRSTVSLLTLAERCNHETVASGFVASEFLGVLGKEASSGARSRSRALAGGVILEPPVNNPVGA